MAGREAFPQHPVHILKDTHYPSMCCIFHGWSHGKSFVVFVACVGTPLFVRNRRNIEDPKQQMEISAGPARLRGSMRG